jgi:molecular chaperone DnaK (HSP70)
VARSGSPIFGIDFGTSTTFLARPHLGADVLPLGVNRKYLPSLAGTLGGQIVAGEHATTLPLHRRVRSAKRAITEGREVFRVPGPTGVEELPRDEVIAAILAQLAVRAKAVKSTLVKSSRIRLGCPAMWTRPQRDLLRSIAERAGLPVAGMSLIEEPVAAGIAWLDGQVAAGQDVGGRLLVFDIGGGTLDVAVMQVCGGDRPDVTVLASLGAQEAGDDLDDRIAEQLIAELGLDLDNARDPEGARADLWAKATEAKIALSEALSHGVLLNRRLYGAAPLAPVRLRRAQLEEALQPQLDRAQALVWQAVKLARLTHLRAGDTRAVLAMAPQALAGDIDYVLLVGGMSRIPLVRRRIAEMFPQATIFHDFDVPADEAVVAGLVSETGYNTVNMYRPGFDVELSWAGVTVPLYQAHDPLFSLYQLQSGQTWLGHRQDVRQRDGLPRQGRGELRVRTRSGETVQLAHAATTVSRVVEDVQTLPIPFGHYDVRFVLYCDGRIAVTDGAGRDHELRIHGWPEIVGPDSRPIAQLVPDPPLPYPYDKP